MIIDASIAVKWLVIEDDSGAALALLGTENLIGPTLLHAEVGNAIWKKHRRGELGDDPELETLPDRLASIVTTIDEAPLMGRALQIAMSLNHPIYDCVYLTLAEQMSDELMTADERFLAVVRGTPLATLVRSLG